MSTARYGCFGWLADQIKQIKGYVTREKGTNRCPARIPFAASLTAALSPLEDKGEDREKELRGAFDSQGAVCHRGNVRRSYQLMLTRTGRRCGIYLPFFWGTRSTISWLPDLDKVGLGSLIHNTGFPQRREGRGVRRCVQALVRR